MHRKNVTHKIFLIIFKWTAQSAIEKIHSIIVRQNRNKVHGYDNKRAKNMIFQILDWNWREKKHLLLASCEVIYRNFLFLYPTYEQVIQREKNFKRKPTSSSTWSTYFINVFLTSCWIKIYHKGTNEWNYKCFSFLTKFCIKKEREIIKLD